MSTIAPYATAAASTVTYASLLKLLTALQRPPRGREDDSIPSVQLRALIKAVSALHSTATTLLALVALNQSWAVPAGTDGKVSSSSLPMRALSSLGQRNAEVSLDDTKNPIVAGKNRLANAITAWELGYLIYDTGALFFEANYGGSKSGQSHGGGFIRAVSRLCKSSPVFVAHHAALVAALSYLQTYIATDREKGVWVIVAFLCMNASNPLLHLRWCNYKKTQRHSQKIDLALAAVFASTRFGIVYWVMKRYGQFHGLAPLEAMMKQRWQCQFGTGVLTSMNLVWWVGLLMQMSYRAGARQAMASAERQGLLKANVTAD